MSGADPARSVLALYPFAPFSVEPLARAGGFSGARLWQVAAKDGVWCLKAWPPRPGLTHHMECVHRWMHVARSAGLEFVPRVRATRDGLTYVSTGEWAWDMCEWMPGTPVADPDASNHHVAAACRALAHLHRVWGQREQRHGPSTAVQRRINRLASLPDLSFISGKRREQFISWHDATLRTLAEWVLVYRFRAQRDLESLAHISFDLHPCLADIWRDHVLFDHDEVVGMIDFGSARIDSPSADLARLLGSLLCRQERFRIGIEAYRCVKPLSSLEERMVYVLDSTGIVGAAMNWLEWLGPQRRHFEDPEGVQRRLDWTLRRLQQLQVEAWN